MCGSRLTIYVLLGTLGNLDTSFDPVDGRIRNYSPFATLGTSRARSEREREQGTLKNNEYEAEPPAQFGCPVIKLPRPNPPPSSSAEVHSSTEPWRSSRQLAVFAVGEFCFLLDALCQSLVERCNINSYEKYPKIYVSFLSGDFTTGGNIISKRASLHYTCKDTSTRHPHPVFHIASGLPAESSTENVDSFHGDPFHWYASVHYNPRVVFWHGNSAKYEYASCELEKFLILY